MGKRELLLLVVFVVLGVGVYQVSAPAAPADAPGFSLSRMVQMAKSHFVGDAVRTPVTRTATLAVTPEVTTLDLGEVRGAVFVAGTDREDILVRLDTVIGGMDEADVAQQEKGLGLAVTGAGPVATVAVSFERGGRPPRHELHIEVPSRLKVQLGGRGSAEIRGVASVHLDEYRGELNVAEVAGPITGDLRESRAEFGPGTRMDLDTRSVRLRAEAPASVVLRSERGTVDVMDATGPVSIKTDFARMDIRGTGGPVHITGEGGTIELRDVRHPLTIEADRLTVNAELAIPVATTITVDDDTVEVTLPAEGGVQLEAAIENGSLRLPDGMTATKTGAREAASARLGAGGPLVKVTVNTGALRVRTRAGRPATE